MKRPTTSVLTIDLGGTKIRAGLVGRDLRVHEKRTIPTPQYGSVSILNALLGLIYTFPRSSYGHVAVAFAGLTSWPDGSVLTAPSLPDVTNVPLRRYLQRILRRKVTVENDVTLWTLG